MTVVPFIDRVKGSSPDDLHPADGYYERNAYPVKSVKDAGATLVAGSDAPVDTRDPRPFVNMQMAVTRAFNGQRALNPSQRVALRDVIDAYTINGARYLDLDKVAGSIEPGKSADFILLDQDILALADAGDPGKIGSTKVLGTWFMGRKVYDSK
jgi:predicted amidohydrolase YtcJ